MSSLEPVSHLPARARRRISHDVFTNIRTDASRARKPASDRRHERVPASSSTARTLTTPHCSTILTLNEDPDGRIIRDCTLGYLCAFRVYLATGDKQISRARRTHPVVSLSFTPTPDAGPSPICPCFSFSLVRPLDFSLFADASSAD